MLVCFGCSWPMSVYKNIKAKTAKSMSLPFILLIITGYICGIAAKLITNTINYVLAVYLLNLIIVSADLAVYFINRKHDIEESKKAAKADSEIHISKGKNPVISDKSLNSKIKEFEKVNGYAKHGGTVFFGGKYFAGIPVNEFAQDFESDEPMYNRSFGRLTAEDSICAFDEAVKPIYPDAVFVNLGEQDLKRIDFNEDEFIDNYKWLIDDIHSGDTAVYIVSVISDSPMAKALNQRIKALADETDCEYIDAVNVLQSECPQQNLFSMLCSLNVRQRVSFTNAMSM